jgi:hypothetical protein
MVTPGHGDHIGYFTTPVGFHGFSLAPGQKLEIQAKHPQRGWETIGGVQSFSNSVFHAGQKWYPWDGKIVVPSEFWTCVRIFQPAMCEVSAEVRAIDPSDGSKLYAFESGFYDWFSFNESLGDMWDAHGHGTSVTIYADQAL